MSQAPFNAAGAAVHSNPLVVLWLEKAVADLQTAEREFAVTTHPNYDAVCFHAQQGAEKLMKAWLTGRGQVPPRVHDLVHLDTLVRQSAPSWSFPVVELSNLNQGAVDARYPGVNATRSDAEESIATATKLWASLRPLV